MVTSFFRYPGGKSRLKKFILPVVEEKASNYSTLTYCEPFLGGGSVGLAFIYKHKSSISKVVLNDKDPAIADLWTSVIQTPDKLSKLVSDFNPSVGSFFEFKDRLLSYRGGGDAYEWGFMKLAVHQMSYSGLGTVAGGPIGGLSQKSDYDVGCRWSPKSIIPKIYNISNLLNSVGVKGNKCSSNDFSNFIKEQYFLYLDPPYFKKGSELYEYYFKHEDHVRLSELLRGCKSNWILSYDCQDEILELYSNWAKVSYIDKINYTINTSREAKELIITND